MLYEEFGLKSYNTFGVPAWTQYFYAFHDEYDLRDFLQATPKREIPVFVLGGGSNVLFIGNFYGLILHPQIAGISAMREDDNDVYVRVGAGVDWDELVAWTVEKGYFGLENLSLIPGQVGAAPIQNIGAYGVEVKDYIYQVEMIDITTGDKEIMSAEQCQFGYRDSVFKNDLKGKKVITYVTFKLSKTPVYHLEYGSLMEEVDSYGEINLHHVRKAVIAIRESKLPDPAVIGNAGSFFKNPVVSREKFIELQHHYPQIPSYKVSEEEIKIPAAWLIEKCGWKGQQKGQAGVHDKQPLVLINLGKASGGEILALAKEIQDSVIQKFDINLNMEVNLIGKSCS